MKKKTKIQALASICVIVVAALVGLALVATREPAGKSEPRKPSVLVDTMTVEKKKMAPDFVFKGTLRAARRLSLPARVGGEIVWVNDSFEVGGLIARGEDLVRIERSDYQARVQEAKAQLAEARARLELERGRQSVAEEELEFYRERETVSNAEARPELVLREPQLEIAQAAVMRAEAALEVAQLDLERTRIVAPFDCVVEEESVEIGQSLQPGSRVAVLLGTSRGLVEARVSARNLRHLSVPGWNSDLGSTGIAQYRIGGPKVERQARVLRLAGSLDPAGRMARLVCEVEDPLGLVNPESEYRTEDTSVPMLFGAFVELHIPTKREIDLVELPGWALRGDNQVYVMNDEGKLEIRKPEIYMRGRETAYVSAGIEGGDKIVTSLIANPIEGMALRDAESNQSEPEQGEPHGNERDA